MDALLRPRSIALIGASRDPESMSGTLLRNLAGSFDGPLYPVNPNTTEIGSLRCYPSIEELPGPVDLAFIAVPSRFVLEVARQCVDTDVAAVVVITAGFGETDEAGRQRAVELQNLARTAAIPLVGPNCLGLLSTADGAAFNGTFSATQPQPGSVAVCTQSGALGFVFPECNRRWNIGISKLVSLGNKLCLGENDLLAALEHDTHTDVVQLYLESFQDAREFREVATRLSQAKPIVGLKAGRTASGKRAASSHTAALATPARAADALFQQSGVISANSLEQLFDITALLATQPLPRGRRVAVLSNAGGPGVLCADAVEAAGLDLTEFSNDLQKKLQEFLPAEATVCNPIDLIGSTSPDEFQRCLTEILKAHETDAVIIIYVPRLAETSDAIAAGIVDVAQQHKPSQTLLTVFMQLDAAPSVLSHAQPQIPAWMYPESAVSALAAAVRLTEWRQRRLCSPAEPAAKFDTLGVRNVFDQAIASGDLSNDGWLSPSATSRLLNAAGISVVADAIVHSMEEAVSAAGQLGYPVVTKAIAPGLVHRTDAGAVVVDLRDESALRTAVCRLQESVPGCDSLLLQKFIDCDREMLVGVSREAGFGHLMAFGPGGTQVEALGQMMFRMHPLSTFDAEELVGQPLPGRLLASFRGREPGDRAALIKLLLQVSELVAACPEIAELDLNPVKVLDEGHGVCVVDARVRIAPTTIGQAVRQETGP
jgi:acyl-CoA synthetase (NDP forming)